MTTDQQLIDAIRPIIEAAAAIDPRINCCIVNVDLTNKKPYVSLYGNFPPGSGPQSGFEVELMLSRVKPHDPKSEKLAAIEKLRAEIAALETTETEAK